MEDGVWTLNDWTELGIGYDYTYMLNFLEGSTAYSFRFDTHTSLLFAY